MVGFLHLSELWIKIVKIVWQKQQKYKVSKKNTVKETHHWKVVKLSNKAKLFRKWNKIEQITSREVTIKTSKTK